LQLAHPGRASVGHHMLRCAVRHRDRSIALIGIKLSEIRMHEVFNGEIQMEFVFRIEFNGDFAKHTRPPC